MQLRTEKKKKIAVCDLLLLLPVVRKKDNIRRKKDMVNFCRGMRGRVIYVD